MFAKKYKFFNLSKNIHGLFFNVFLFSIVCSSYQICIIREINLLYTYAGVQFITNIIINLTFLGLGIGAVIASRYLRRNIFSALGFFIGFSIFIVLLILLKLFPLLPVKLLCNTEMIILVSFTIFTPMILLGMVFSLLTTHVMMENKKLIPAFVATNMLGLAIGYLLISNFICIKGLHTVLILISLLTILSSFLPKKFAIILVLLIGLLPIENQVSKLEAFKPSHILNIPGLRKIYSGWSPYHKIDFYASNNDTLVCFYNYKNEWWLANGDNNYFMNFLYVNLITPASEVLLLCTGGGTGVIEAQKRNPKNLVAVEIDPLVVSLMKGRFSHFNQNIYNIVKTFAMDARAFLEKDNHKYDLICYEASLGTVTRPLNIPISIENHLYTVEGLKTACSHLKKSGVILIGPTRDKKVFSRLCNTFTLIDIPFQGFQCSWEYPYLAKDITRDWFYIIASYSQSSINSFFNKCNNLPGYITHFKKVSNQIMPVPVVTDNRPFFYIYDSGLSRLLAGLCILFFFTFIGGSLVFSRGEKTTLFFFLVGFSYITTFYFVYSKFRSFICDPLTTIAVLNAIMIPSVALGNFCSARINFKKYFWQYILCFIMASAWLLIATENIPFGDKNTVIKVLISIIIVFPCSFLMGLFFPLGLKELKKEENTFTAYLFDSLGTVFGLSVFYLISLTIGFTGVFYPAFTGYLIALFILRRSQALHK